MRKNKSVRFLTESAMIAALYAALTLVTGQFSVSAIQLRLSEALTILPVFTPCAVPGLAVGCLAANLLSSCAPLDTVIGTAVTLTAAILTRLLKKTPLPAVLPPVLLNAAVLPLIFLFVYRLEGTYLFFLGTTLLSEALTAGLLGLLLFRVLDRYRDRLFDS